MPKDDPAHVLRVMRQTVAMLQEARAITATDEIDPVAFFGFRPEQVACIHSRKVGAGGGVWFRLKDGRVFNRYGGIDDPNPSLYDPTVS